MARYLLAAAIFFCIQGWLSGQEKERPYLSYMQLYRRSSCQPREVLVNIHQEHPQEVAHFFKPCCVVLLRCRGCCSGDSFRCSAVAKRTLSLQILRVNSHQQTSKMEGMKFTEHVTCECRPRIVNRTKNRKSGKRTRSQVPGEPRARLSFA